MRNIDMLVLALCVFDVTLVFADPPCEPGCGSPCDPGADPVECLLDQYPDVQTHFSDFAAVVRVFYGAPMTQGDTACEAAQEWVNCHADAFGVDFDEENVLEFVRANVLSSGKFTAFAYRQVIEGAPVARSMGRILVLNGSPNRVVYAAAKLLREPPVGGFAPDTVTALEALTSVQNMPEYSGLVEWSPEPDIEKVVYAGGQTPVRAWKFFGRKIDAYVTEAYTFFVNAADGELIHVQNDVVELTEVSGSVTGYATPFEPRDAGPDTEDYLPAETALPGVRVQLLASGDSTYTNDDGSYAVAYTGPPGTTTTVRADLAGRWVTVTNLQGSDVFGDFPNPVEPPQSPVDLTLNEGSVPPNPSVEFDTAQLNCAIHADRTHDFFASRVPDFTEVDGPAECQVNFSPATCNARYAGEGTIIFRAASPESCDPEVEACCPNTAYSTVIADEYGHFVVDMLGHPTALAFPEGLADSPAILSYDDPAVGRDMFGPGLHSRDYESTDAQYPCESGAPYYCAQVLGRVWWNTREKMCAGFADSSEALEFARQLFTSWTLTTIGVDRFAANHSVAVEPQTAVEILVLDDDDGDLYNGTPNDCLLSAALADRNVPCPPPLPDTNQNNIPDYCECADAGSCCDVDINGIRDSNCVWCECVNPPGGTCNQICIGFADMGGAFGACPPDGFCNNHDANHALTCFSGKNPCEDINIDAGGSFGNCEPDGFCNIHDAYHALDCFSGVSTCSCPGGEMAAMQGPQVVGTTTLAALPAAVAVTPDTVRVRVFTQNALEDLRGYQLDVVVSGGAAGQLELLDISIEPRDDFVFAGRDDAFDAFNVTKGQMLCGLEAVEGVAAPAGAYLATYTYRVPTAAEGQFVINFAHDESAGDQTFLLASNNGKITIADTTAAVVAATAETT